MPHFLSFTWQFYFLFSRINSHFIIIFSQQLNIVYKQCVNVQCSFHAHILLENHFHGKQQMSSKLPENELPMCSKWAANELQMCSKWATNELQMCSKLPANELQMSSKWAANVQQMSYKWAANELQMCRK